MKLYVLQENKPTGPFEEAEIILRWKKGTVCGADLVWREGLTEWTPLANVLSISGSNSIPPKNKELDSEEKRPDNYQKTQSVKWRWLVPIALAAIAFLPFLLWPGYRYWQQLHPRVGPDDHALRHPDDFELLHGTGLNITIQTGEASPTPPETETSPTISPSNASQSAVSSSVTNPSIDDQARITEGGFKTVEECDSRYGSPYLTWPPPGSTFSPNAPATETRSYLKNGFNLEIDFISGVAHRIRVYKHDGGDMDWEEIDAFLESTKGNSEWEKANPLDARKRKRSDGMAFSKYISVQADSRDLAMAQGSETGAEIYRLNYAGLTIYTKLWAEKQKALREESKRKEQEDKRNTLEEMSH